MIFGSEEPKFVTQSGVTVLLGHSNIEPNWMTPNLIEHQSVLNGHREWIEVSGEHAEFSVTINLHKYPSAENKFREIYTHRNSEVYFHPHKDKAAIRDADDNRVLFKIVEVTPFYLYYDEAYVNYDALIIKFRSKDPVDYEKTLNSVFLLGEKDGNLITEKDGDAIRIKRGPALVE